jgi:glycosyltransferase involved in cell wall biosynthesis
MLKEVTLAAIVRDELMNAAGGIVDFIESTVPFVEHAVIVDTGSVDGTREELENLKKKYSNLEVYDHRFDGFANSRNYSLSKVQTEYTLVLDADERLASWDFDHLTSTLERKKPPLNLWFKVIPPISKPYRPYYPLNPRIFPTKGSKFHRSVIETLRGDSSNYGDAENAGITVKHFLSCENARELKSKFFYSKIIGFHSQSPGILEERTHADRMFSLVCEILDGARPARFVKLNLPPEVKQYNPRRDLYRLPFEEFVSLLKQSNEYDLLDFLF